MYLDVLGLVTTGIGNLIDTPDDALSLEWLRSDGSVATRREVAAEWTAVKARKDLAQRGGGAFKAITRLRLSDAGLHDLFNRTLDRMARQLATRFPGFDDWPADAQLATISMAWACGPAFRFPKLAAALNAGDFATAAVECKMNEAGNPGLKPRNAANRLLYENAAAVVARDLDPELLYWPNQAPPSRPASSFEAPVKDDIVPR